MTDTAPPTSPVLLSEETPNNERPGQQDAQAMLLVGVESVQKMICELFRERAEMRKQEEEFREGALILQARQYSFDQREFERGREQEALRLRAERLAEWDKQLKETEARATALLREAVASRELSTKVAANVTVAMITIQTLVAELVAREQEIDQRQINVATREAAVLQNRATVDGIDNEKYLALAEKERVLETNREVLNQREADIERRQTEILEYEQLLLDERTALAEREQALNAKKDPDAVALAEKERSLREAEEVRIAELVTKLEALTARHETLKRQYDEVVEESHRYAGEAGRFAREAEVARSQLATLSQLQRPDMQRSPADETEIASLREQLRIATAHAQQVAPGELDDLREKLHTATDLLELERASSSKQRQFHAQELEAARRKATDLAATLDGVKKGHIPQDIPKTAKITLTPPAPAPAREEGELHLPVFDGPPEPGPSSGLPALGHLLNLLHSPSLNRTAIATALTNAQNSLSGYPTPETEEVMTELRTFQARLKNNSISLYGLQSLATLVRKHCPSWKPGQELRNLKAEIAGLRTSIAEEKAKGVAAEARIQEMEELARDRERALEAEICRMKRKFKSLNRKVSGNNDVVEDDEDEDDDDDDDKELAEENAPAASANGDVTDAESILRAQREFLNAIVPSALSGAPDDTLLPIQQELEDPTPEELALIEEEEKEKEEPKGRKRRK